jgi:uncharacterized membrane protein YsdA (DUF1294 family)/cold shock CspA family protein
MRPAARFAGRIVEWNDEKGFGFVTPSGGGARAFVHVNAFQRGSRRPVDGDLISYVAAPDTRGRLQAREIRHAGQKIAVRREPSRIPRIAIGVAALAALVTAWLGNWVPAPVPVAYFALSTFAFLAYRSDKAAAGTGASRTPENVLHMFSLLSGWPGALIAQQRLRHKTIKQPFQTIFWFTVAFNLVAVGYLVASGKAARLAAVFGG